jgi:dTDP-glucose 4,6-dehydratase
MRLDDGRVIPNFIRQALTGQDLTVYGDGEQTRSFCYVTDLIDGLVALMDADVQTPINLGRPDERTINELAELVLEVTGSDSEITHEPLPPQDPAVRRPDISKATAALDWEPTTGLRAGLERTVEYFRPRV